MRRQERLTRQQLQVQRSQQQRYWHQDRARSRNYQWRTWRQRGGYHGYRLPTYYFNAYYGPRHWFRIYNLPFMIVGGLPRFQYGGYWFQILDPYPYYWGYDWYRSDDVYVDYVNDGYYLFNRRFPGRPGIAISIIF
jgi:hypothetical protein